MAHLTSDMAAAIVAMRQRLDECTSGSAQQMANRLLLAEIGTLRSRVAELELSADERSHDLLERLGRGP